MTDERRALMFRNAAHSALAVGDRVHDDVMEICRDVYGADMAAMVYDKQADPWFAVYRRLDPNGRWS